MIYVGTSGFSYKEWKGTFYPEKLLPREFLTFYARHFRTTEINNTFYRSPSRKTTSHWASQVPDDFRFTLKLNRRITHSRKLVDVSQEMEWFLDGASPLEEKLGAILVQLPPYFRFQPGPLEEFLDRFRGQRLAFEFRHPSWFEEGVYRLLREHCGALVLAETDDRPAPRVRTADFVYVRLRKSEYSREDLQEWSDWIGAQDCDAFIYLKHASRAPELASELMELLGESSSPW